MSFLPDRSESPINTLLLLTPIDKTINKSKSTRVELTLIFDLITIIMIYLYLE